MPNFYVLYVNHVKTLLFLLNLFLFYIIDRENDKTKLFSDDSSFPDVLECKEKITAITKEIREHRRQVRLIVRQPALEYSTVLGTEVNFYINAFIIVY